jgi:hypothetical protein
LRRPGSTKTNGKVNEYYYAMFPGSFRWGFATLGSLSPGVYIVTAVLVGMLREGDRNA